MGIPPEQVGRGQYHTGDTETALDCAMLYKGVLDWMQFAFRRNALNRRNAAALELRCEHEARQATLAVHQHRACPAITCPAGFLGAGQAQVFPEQIHDPAI
jgi:hypothetical protein